MVMTSTLKALNKHKSAVTGLLDSLDCDYPCNGIAKAPSGITTHSWYIARTGNQDSIGIEISLEDLRIHYDRIHRGPNLRLYSERNFRIDLNHNPESIGVDHGDCTVDLLDELEDVIAGNDYSFVRNFIQQKRSTYLTDLTRGIPGKISPRATKTPEHQRSLLQLIDRRSILNFRNY